MTHISEILTPTFNMLIKSHIQSYSKGDYDFEVIGSVVATYLVLDTGERYDHAIMTLEDARAFWLSL
jgi:hypothetical protein